MAEITELKARELNDKLISGTITKTEKKQLFEYFAPLFTGNDSNVNFQLMNNVLLANHKDYGKPDSNGNIIDI